MNNILVTGGTGFIGSNLAARLSELGYNVRILRRANSDLRAVRGVKVDQCIGDLLHPESLHRAMKGCDTVFHTAAIVSFARKHRELQMSVNVEGTAAVVEACIANGVRRLVHTSSIAAVGHPGPGATANEETKFNWPHRSGYRLSKHLAEQKIREGVEKGLDAVIVNPTVVIGERDIHMHGGQLIKVSRKGVVPFYIEGGMNIVYVGDVVNGHIQAAEKGRKGHRYILGGTNMTHKEIFQQTARLLGGRAPFVKLPLSFLQFSVRLIESLSTAVGVEPWISADLVAGAGVYNWYSSEKAQQELGYVSTSFEKTILAAYRWYAENGFL